MSFKLLFTYQKVLIFSLGSEQEWKGLWQRHYGWSYALYWEGDKKYIFLQM